MAFFLLVFSYLYNCWKIGALVVFLHDSSDVLLTLVRVLADYKHINKNLINGIFVFNVLFWIYSRIIYFPMYVIYEPIVVSSSGRIDKYGYFLFVIQDIRSLSGSIGWFHSYAFFVLCISTGSSLWSRVPFITTKEIKKLSKDTMLIRSINKKKTYNSIRKKGDIYNI